MDDTLQNFLLHLGRKDAQELIYNNHPDFALIQLPDQLVLAGTENGHKEGISRFLQGGLLENFRFVRTLYHNPRTRDMVLDSLVSDREKIADVLDDHYGEFTYSPYESAFDEYLVAMRERRGIEITDAQALKHAGAADLQELKAMGYSSADRYILAKIPYREKEELLVAGGAIPYREWIEHEIDRFLAAPSLLIRQYSCRFENIFPDTVWLDKDAFIQEFTGLDLPGMIQLVFGKSASHGTYESLRFIAGIPTNMQSFWT